MRLLKMTKFISRSFFIFILAFYTSVQSSHFIDVDAFDFQSEGRKGIRVATYNLERQKYEYIAYWCPKAPNLTYLQLRISKEGEVTINPDMELKKYHIRSVGDIIKEGQKKKLKLDKDYENRNILWAESEASIKTGVEIKNYLNNYNNPTQGEEFKVSAIKDNKRESRLLSQIINPSDATKGNKDIAQNATSKERGALGELATRLTMISFGYVGFHGQNNSNNGFDGVWVDNFQKPSWLILSESKFRVEKVSIEKYMKDELNESQIQNRLKVAPPKTQTLIEEFITKKPEAIIKFLHRLKKNGGAICLLETFSGRTYDLVGKCSRLSKSSTEEEKCAALRAPS